MGIALRSILADLTQVGLQMNLGELEELRVRPDCTCEAIFPTAGVHFTWEGKLIRSYSRTPETTARKS